MHIIRPAKKRKKGRMACFEAQATQVLIVGAGTGSDHQPLLFCDKYMDCHRTICVELNGSLEVIMSAHNMYFVIYKKGLRARHII